MHITIEDATSHISKQPNWKAVVPDGIQGYKRIELQLDVLSTVVCSLEVICRRKDNIIDVK